MLKFVLRRHTEICTDVVEIPYDARSLYAGLEVNKTSVDVKTNSRGFMLCAVGCLWLAVGDWLTGWLNKAHGFKRFELLVVSPRGALIAICSVVGMARCACCTSSGQVVLSRHSSKGRFLIVFLGRGLILLRSRGSCMAHEGGGTLVLATTESVISIAWRPIWVFRSVTSPELLHIGRAIGRA